MLSLSGFVGEELQPVSNASEASTAAAIRNICSQYAGLPKKEAGLERARMGFMDDSVRFRTLHTRTSKHNYKVRIPDGRISMARFASGTAV